MWYGARIIPVALLALFLTGTAVVQSASAQSSPVARGKGKEVVRKSTGERGTTTGAERERTSGRSDRGARDVRVERDDARVERTTSRDGRVVVTRDRRTEQRRAGDVYSRRDDDWDDYGEGSGRKGPKFCQNGQGHPVHGMSWCYEKGFGRADDRWRRSRDLEDIIIGRPDPRTERPRRIADILDDVVIGRLKE